MPSPLSHAIGSMVTGPSPERARFMKLLSEHEDLVMQLVAAGGSGARVEELRMSRRAVVAAYDQQTLRTIEA